MLQLAAHLLGIICGLNHIKAVSNQNQVCKENCGITVMHNLHCTWVQLSDDTKMRTCQPHTQCQRTSQNFGDEADGCAELQCVAFTAVYHTTDPMPTFAQTVSKY